MNPKLGKLQKISIKEIWSSEEEFNKWLSKEGIKQLSEILNMNIKVINTEVNIGNFYADIIGIEDSMNSNNKIIIECQFGKTDHRHLGQIITYSANSEANIIIWITEKFTTEHKTAIEWLNNITENSNINIVFYLIGIEVIKIDNSNPAINFTIISSPNNERKLLKQISTQKLGKLSKMSLSFLKKLEERFNEENITNRKISASAPSVYIIKNGKINKYKYDLRISLNNTKHFAKIGLRFYDKKILPLLKKIFEKDKEIIIDKMPKNKSCSIDVIINRFDVKDENKHEKYINDIKNALKKIEEKKKILETII